MVAWPWRAFFALVCFGSALYFIQSFNFDIQIPRHLKEIPSKAPNNQGPKIVLNWNVFDRNQFWPDASLQHYRDLSHNCRAKCTFHPPNASSEILANADAIIFYPPYYHTLRPDVYATQHPKPPNQTWWMMTWESDKNHPHQTWDFLLENVDHMMTYSLKSTVPITYASSVWKNDFYYLNQNKRTDVPIIAIVSNCNQFVHNERHAWMVRLMELLPVHSYGPCLNNHLMGTDTGRESRRKFELMGTYKFCLAFENTNQEDYVTEKFYTALAAGCVPIYMGAPNIDHYLPHPAAVIKTADFQTPEELAKYLQRLTEQPELYNKHLEWKGHSGPRLGEAKLRHLQFLSIATAPCRLCEFVAGVSSERTPEEEARLYKTNVDIMVKDPVYKALIDNEDNP